MERYEHQFSGIGSYPRVSCFGLKYTGERSQGRSKYFQGSALCSSSTSNHIASHVSPVRLDTRGQIVTHVIGSSIGIVATLAGPSVIKPRRCPCLPYFRRPYNDSPLKHPCDCNGGCLQQTVRHTVESLIILRLVEVLPERLLLPSDSCTRNTEINVKCR